MRAFRFSLFLLAALLLLGSFVALAQAEVSNNTYSAGVAEGQAYWTVWYKYYGKWHSYGWYYSKGEACEAADGLLGGKVYGPFYDD